MNTETPQNTTPTDNQPSESDIAICSVGYCESCYHWEGGYCRNQSRLYEDGARQNEEGDNESSEDDCLVYDYYEGGGFKTGANFGCVHHTPNVERDNSE